MDLYVSCASYITTALLNLRDQSFNQAGGGVYAAFFDDSGIKVGGFALFNKEEALMYMVVDLVLESRKRTCKRQCWLTRHVNFRQSQSCMVFLLMHT